MNNFNKVFLAVRKHIEKQKLLAEINSLDTIAKEVNIPLDKLPIYLDYLQDLGLIKYSLEEKYIHLTEFGKKQERHINE